MSFPLIAGAQAKTVKVGVLHPVTGALAYSGQQCRMGALMAIEDINKLAASSHWAAPKLKPCWAMLSQVPKPAQPKLRR
jgi:branched-chain amino acid transport system substrate-binding protein